MEGRNGVDNGRRNHFVSLPLQSTVTTFLFSYYSPVTTKTQNEEPHAALFIEKLPLLIINLGTCHEPEPRLKA